MNLKAANAIQKNISDVAEVVVWDKGIFKIQGGFLDGILSAVNESDFGVFVFSPDDTVTIRTQEHSAVRDNVVFEYGLFMGRLGRSRSFFVVPKEAERLWLPTDLAGIVFAHYDGTVKDEDLEESLKSACELIRNAILEEGIRAARYRQISIETSMDVVSPRYKSLTGKWVGFFDQRANSATPAARAEFTFDMIALPEGLMGEGSFIVPDLPKIPRVSLRITGAFYHHSFLRLDYSNTLPQIMQFGCGMLELDELATEMKGEYVGFGAWSKCVVSGTIAVRKANESP